MKKHIPISLNKYERFMRKLPKYFFPGKNMLGYYSTYMNKDFSLFGTESYHRNNSGFKNFDSQNQSYDKKQILGPVQKSYVLDTINKFIDFPKFPKTYIKRKKSNDYNYLSHTSTFAVSSMDISAIQEAGKDLKLIEALNNSMNNFSTYLSAFERGYHFHRQAADIMSDKFYFFKHDDNDRISLFELLNDIPDNVPFLLALSKATSIVSLNEKTLIDELHYFDPIRWKDNFTESKVFYDKVFKVASKNAVLAQNAIVIKLQTINYDLLSYHTNKINNIYKETDPAFLHKYKDKWMNETFSPNNKKDNSIILKYFFYELIDYEEYI